MKEKLYNLKNCQNRHFEPFFGPNHDEDFSSVVLDFVVLITNIFSIFPPANWYFLQYLIFMNSYSH